MLLKYTQAMIPFSNCGGLCRMGHSLIKWLTQSLVKLNIKSYLDLLISYYIHTSIDPLYYHMQLWSNAWPVVQELNKKTSEYHDLECYFQLISLVITLRHFKKCRVIWYTLHSKNCVWESVHLSVRLSVQPSVSTSFSLSAGSIF